MRAVIGLGSNVGSRGATLTAAERFLGARFEVLGRSSRYETEPVGPPQPNFLNAALALEVACSPEALLEMLLGIEASLGRVRAERWGPRTLDLDLLHFEGARRQSPRLTVPHPRLEDRAFALAPLLDVAPWLAATYSPALLAVGGPPQAPPALPERSEQALARALNHWARGGGSPLATAPVVAASPPEWVQIATGLPGLTGAVVERITPAEVVGHALLDGSDRRLSGRLDGAGTQVVVIAARTKVG